VQSVATSDFANVQWPGGIDRGSGVLGIILTVIAVTLAICFAFYPSEGGYRSDLLFDITSKNRRKNSKASDIEKD
jgi:hypothetical protein